MCGKLNLIEEEAVFIVNSSQYRANKYYICPLSPDKPYFHATSRGPGKGKIKPKNYGSNRFKFNTRRLLSELQAQQEHAKIIPTKEEAMGVNKSRALSELIPE